MMKKSSYSESVERYVDCPYCGHEISDEGGSESEFGPVESGLSVKCPSCKRKFEVIAPWESVYQNNHNPKPSPGHIVEGSIWETKTWGSEWIVTSVNSGETVTIDRMDIPSNANPDWKEFHKTIPINIFLIHYRRIR